jgi:Mrp family chromosome partitioning ATPase
MAQEQVQALNTQISVDRDRLKEIETQLAQSKDDSVVTALSLQRNITLDRIDRATASIGQFTSTITNLQQRRNYIEILQQAQVPPRPEDSGAARLSLLGAVVGGGFAVGVILLVEFWDTSVKTAKDVSKLLDIPVLGTIVRYGNKTDTYPERLVSRDEVHVSVFERYRGIEAYLSLAARRTDSYKPVFIMTSAEPGEGKSINASNLAFVAAAMGRRVLLIDADLRHPKIHEIFQLNNDAGLVTLLAATMSLKSSPENMSLVLASTAQTMLESALINPCVQRTSSPNLSIITAGPASAKSLQLLESDFLPRWIEIFKFYLDVDMIIIDTPPCLVVTDATILAGSIPSNVVLVAEAGRTRPDALIRTKQQFSQLGSTIVGVILNKANPQDDGPTNKYNYYLTEATDGKNILVIPETTNRPS